MKNTTRGNIILAALGLLAACVACEEEGGSGSPGGAGAAGAAGAMPEVGGAGGAGECSGVAGSCDPTGAIIITSAEDDYWQLGQVTEVTSGDADVTVDDGAEAQTWEGFGGCFTELGWVYLSELSEDDQERAIELLFGSEGARFTWGRIPIGGNDYVLSRYTLDDTGEDVVPNSTESNRPPPDLELSSFSIDRDLEHLIPYITAAQAVNPDIRFWAIPWTPPVWMKTGYTGDADSGVILERPSYYDGGTMKDDEETLTAHAQYFVKFIEAYGEQGIDVDLVAPQGEPGYEMTYPSCYWDKGTYTDFIGRYLGPALDDAGLETRIMLGSLDNGTDTSIVNAVLADPTATEYCAAAGVGYDMASVSKVSAIKAAGIPVWIAEHKAGNYPWLPGYETTAPNDMAYAIESWGLIRDAITKLGVTVYNAWSMVLDEVGMNISAADPWAQNALLVADSGELTVTPAYYVFRHFSRYVEPGAKVVGTSGGDAVAFKNPDGSHVVVAYNSGSATTMTVAIGEKRLQFSVPGNGFATLVTP